MTLAFFQWAAERSVPALWLTEYLTGTLARAVSAVTGLAIHIDGTVATVRGYSIDIAPACLGLAAVTVYLAAVLSTPAGWSERLRGVGRGLLAIALANVVRVALLAVFFLYAFSVFGFVHVPMWGTVVPLFLLAVWGLWLVRDLHYLPRFPLKFSGLVAVFAVVLFAAWYALLDWYLVALVVAVNALFSGLAGLPIQSLHLTAADLLRHLDVGFPTGGFRMELAGQTLSLVPCLALILASPLALGRRAGLALGGVAVLFVVNVAMTGVLIVLGWTDRGLVTIFQIVNDFLSLAAGPTLWLLLTRPSAAWFSDVPAQMPRSARNFA